MAVVEEFEKGALGKKSVGVGRERRRETEDVIDGGANLVNTGCVRPGEGVQEQGSLLIVKGRLYGAEDA